MTDRLYKEYADATGLGVIDMYDVINGKEETAKVVADKADIRDSLKAVATSNAKEWLPFASEPYKISSNIKDYVLVPVPIMPSDLPNRNGVGFPLKELTRFNTDTGNLAYQTWKGMPTHQEHANGVLENAKGVILETALRPIVKAAGDVWKVIILCGFDRYKDAYLVNRILTRQVKTYSMGAYVRDYACSITGKLISQGGSEHVTMNKPEFKIVEGKLAYLQALDIKGFECSSVNVPAYPIAENENYMMLDDPSTFGKDVSVRLQPISN